MIIFTGGSSHLWLSSNGLVSSPNLKDEAMLIEIRSGWNRHCLSNQEALFCVYRGCFCADVMEDSAKETNFDQNHRLLTQRSSQSILD
jgi:hypothetical protein